jgi:hypothetical protein
VPPESETRKIRDSSLQENGCPSPNRHPVFSAERSSSVSSAGCWRARNVSALGRELKLMRKDLYVWRDRFLSHPMWRLQLPRHEGTKCWYAGSKGKVMDADASRDAAHEITTVSATAVPLPRPRSQDALSDTERGPLPEPASAGAARSILIWGRPVQLDPTWEEIFARRERRGE